MKRIHLISKLVAVALVVLTAGSAVAELPPLIPREDLFANATFRRPVLSPGGSRLSWLAPSPAGVINVWVRDLDGENSRMVTTEEHRGIRRHFWAGEDRLAYMNTDGTGSTQLTDNAANDHYPCWSPDGEFIAFVSDRDGNPEIYIMRADGSSLHRLTDNPANDWWPSWSD